MTESTTLQPEVPWVDQQHSLLSECIALVEKAVTSEGRSSSVNEATNQLTDLFRMHCEDEERLMRINGYPDFAEHAQEHRELMAYVTKLRDQSLSSEVSLSMMVFLQDWLREHTKTSDKRYALYLANAAAESTK